MVNLEEIFVKILAEGPLVAFMGLLLYLVAKHLQKRDEEDRKRYDNLVDSYLKSNDERTKVIVEALVGNTEVLKEVKARLDASAH